jgi:hypothetical protein
MYSGRSQRIDEGDHFDCCQNWQLVGGQSMVVTMMVVMM